MTIDRAQTKWRHSQFYFFRILDFHDNRKLTQNRSWHLVHFMRAPKVWLMWGRSISTNVKNTIQINLSTPYKKYTANVICLPWSPIVQETPQLFRDLLLAVDMFKVLTYLNALQISFQAAVKFNRGVCSCSVELVIFLRPWSFLKW